MITEQGIRNALFSFKKEDEDAFLNVVVDILLGMDDTERSNLCTRMVFHPIYEEIRQGGAFVGCENPEVIKMMSAPDMKEVHDFLSKGKKVKAIRHISKCTGLEYKDARGCIDGLYNNFKYGS